MKSGREHWDRIFRSTEGHELGWYETDTRPTWDFLERIGPVEGKHILLPGIGTSSLAVELAAQGAALTLNDISAEALDRLRAALPADSVVDQWVNQDISDPLPEDVQRVDVWIDRAVLHFLTEETGIAGYFDNVKGYLQEGGYILFAEFAEDGAEKCAGLPVHRYGVEELTRRLGPGFSLIDHASLVYTNPAGHPRPYIYALFRRG